MNITDVVNWRWNLLPLVANGSAEELCIVWKTITDLCFTKANTDILEL